MSWDRSRWLWSLCRVPADTVGPVAVVTLATCPRHWNMQSQPYTHHRGCHTPPTQSVSSVPGESFTHWRKTIWCPRNIYKTLTTDVTIRKSLWQRGPGRGDLQPSHIHAFVTFRNTWSPSAWWCHVVLLRAAEECRPETALQEREKPPKGLFSEQRRRWRLWFVSTPYRFVWEAPPEERRHRRAGNHGSPGGSVEVPEEPRYPVEREWLGQPGT